MSRYSYGLPHGSLNVARLISARLCGSHSFIMWNVEISEEMFAMSATAAATVRRVMAVNFEVQVGEGPDGLKRALSKLRRGLGVTGVLGEVRRSEFACKPGERRRRKQQRARRRRLKQETTS
jgi:ribosomal protein S21